MNNGSWAGLRLGDDSFDPELNLVYYGSANPGTWNPSQRPGNNKWSMTIFARDVDTGMAKWVYQMTPHDEWDYDGVNEMNIVTRPSAGRRASCSFTSIEMASLTRSIGPTASSSLR